MAKISKRWFGSLFNYSEQEEDGKIVVIAKLVIDSSKKQADKLIQRASDKHLLILTEYLRKVESDRRYERRDMDAKNGTTK